MNIELAITKSLSGSIPFEDVVILFDPITANEIQAEMFLEIINVLKAKYETNVASINEIQSKIKSLRKIIDHETDNEKDYRRSVQIVRDRERNRPYMKDVFRISSPYDDPTTMPIAKSFTKRNVETELSYYYDLLKTITPFDRKTLIAAISKYEQWKISRKHSDFNEECFAQ